MHHTDLSPWTHGHVFYPGSESTARNTHRATIEASGDSRVSDWHLVRVGRQRFASVLSMEVARCEATESKPGPREFGWT